MEKRGEGRDEGGGVGVTPGGEAGSSHMGAGSDGRRLRSLRDMNSAQYGEQSENREGRRQDYWREKRQRGIGFYYDKYATSITKGGLEREQNDASSKRPVHTEPGPRNKGLYVVARNFFLLLLNCPAWPCLAVA